MSSTITCLVKFVSNNSLPMCLISLFRDSRGYTENLTELQKNDPKATCFQLTLLCVDFSGFRWFPSEAGLVLDPAAQEGPADSS